MRLFPLVDRDRSMMLFVDGENLAIRYGALLASRGGTPASHVTHRPDTFVWSTGINNACAHRHVIRKHYYTAIQGDVPAVEALHDEIAAAGIEAPRVFRKTKTRGSKRVDVSLTTEMLSHAARRNYETAVLVAGDEDYVPLVTAVQGEGRRVVLWFLPDGLSPALRRAADHFVDIDDVLFSPELKTWL